MRRIYYLGKDRSTDPRLAGVELEYLAQIDVPEDLAEILVGEQLYSDLPGPPVSLPEEPAPPGISWYEPEPGEELKALTGVSDSRAKWLAHYGIETLADMAALTYTDMASLAEAMPRVSLNTVEDWAKQAEEHPGWVDIEPTDPTH